MVVHLDNLCTSQPSGTTIQTAYQTNRSTDQQVNPEAWEVISLVRCGVW